MPGAGRVGRLFAGTSIVSGVGQAVVTATGRRTEFGAIAHALVEKAPPTEFELGARRFGMLIMRTIVGLVLFVFLVNALLQRDPLESLLFALALAVGPDARVPADDHDRHAEPGGAADGPGQGDRQAAGGDREPRATWTSCAATRPGR